MSKKVTPLNPPNHSGSDGIKPKAVKRGCPVCKNPPHDAFAPFCSKRCADVDLGRWFNGAYSIAGQDGEAVVPANDRDDELD